MQFASSPQEPTHIRTIRGGEAALDAFLHTETTRPLTPPLGQSETPSPTRITRAQRVKATPRKERRSPTPLPRLPTQRHNPPSSPARPPRRSHTDILQIIMEEGDSDRDFIPIEGSYVSLVPPTSPWNTLGTDMIGVHNAIGTATSPTLISPQRYEWLYAAHACRNQGTDFLKDLQSLMLRYHPRAGTFNPHSMEYKPANQWATPRHYNGSSSSHSNQGRKYSPAPSTAPWSRALLIAPHTRRTPPLGHSTTPSAIA